MEPSDDGAQYSQYLTVLVHGNRLPSDLVGTSVVIASMCSPACGSNVIPAVPEVSAPHPWLMFNSEYQVHKWIVLSNPALGSNILSRDTKTQIWNILGTMVR